MGKILNNNSFVMIAIFFDKLLCVPFLLVSKDKRTVFVHLKISMERYQYKSGVDVSFLKMK